MSLDVYLTMPKMPQESRSAIFVREDGQTKEITREGWNKRFPTRDPFVVEIDESHTVFWNNMTHNLGRMANAAGIYKYLWRPDEIGVTHAHQLIEPLQHGLKRLTSAPDMFRAFNPSNGWGTYDGLIVFVSEYLDACEAYPEASVHVSR
jgi:hypothetical protein